MPKPSFNSTNSSMWKGRWTLADTYKFIAAYSTSPRSPKPPNVRTSTPQAAKPPIVPSQGFTNLQSNVRWARLREGLQYGKPCFYQAGMATQRRCFHDYFVTHLPSSSLHPDSRSPTGPHHKLPRAASTPHTPGSGTSPAAAPPSVGHSREMTVVRIPLRSAKHHFGVSVSRGSRPYNEDTYQAGTIELPAFSRRSPISLTRARKGEADGEGTSADGASGDPQVFYFGVFDGHGGNECSDFLREQLHGYIEDSAKKFELESSLKRRKEAHQSGYFWQGDIAREVKSSVNSLEQAGRRSLASIDTKAPGPSPSSKPPTSSVDSKPAMANEQQTPPPKSTPPIVQDVNVIKAVELERSLICQWKDIVGGYYRRFKPEFFSVGSGGRGHAQDGKQRSSLDESKPEGAGIETVMMYAFLKADLEFISAQAQKRDEDSVQAEKALNEGDIFGEPSKSRGTIGGPKRFKGGSTCSIAMISTPTPTPFWHPASPSTLIACHVGDTRILLCSTATGLAIPLTTNHHPSSPGEGSRLRRYAASFVTDSFGEERMSGLANTRAFGDMQSKRIGVSAEPEIKRIELTPAEYSFLVLVSDGISGTLTDQEIVDIVKEAKTPDKGAKDVVSFATEVSSEGDNATCLAVRLGGWERREEGGLGAMGTKELRNWRKEEAINPRNRRT
ncbi:MAG: hypothetical protein M1812_002457 [Candelaria pacifica]|nr:MAG: hypothetical protein M1812_002457 [Candelaria pacifica]